MPPTATDKHTFSAVTVPEAKANEPGSQASGVWALGGSFLGGCLLAAVGHFCAAYAVNPVRDFTGNTAFPAVRSDYRDEKLALLEAFAAAGPVDGIVLGSSRSMLLSGERLQELSGGDRFFNFGLASAKAEDFLAALRYTLKRGHKPKHVWIGVDVESMQDVRVHGDSIHPLRELAVGTPHIASKWSTSARRVFTWSYAQDTAQSVYYRIRPRPAAVGFLPDGTLQYLARERQRRDGTFRLDSEMAGCMAGSRRKIEDARGVSKAQAAYLMQTVDEARAAGASVTLWLTGPHPRTVEHISAGTGYARLVVETWGLLRRLDSNALNLHDPSAYGGSFNGYYDCNHFDVSHARIVERLLLGLPAFDAQSAPLTDPAPGVAERQDIAGGLR